jgi:hypothetical protein
MNVPMWLLLPLAICIAVFLWILALAFVCLFYLVVIRVSESLSELVFEHFDWYLRRIGVFKSFQYFIRHEKALKYIIGKQTQRSARAS